MCWQKKPRVMLKSRFLNYLIKIPMGRAVILLLFYDALKFFCCDFIGDISLLQFYLLRI